MTTNVDKSFEGPSRFEGMFKHAASQKPSTANSFAGQTPTQGGGRWSAMRNHCIEKADEAAKATPFKIHPNSSRFLG
jgi:hypothetical protein